jgi:6-phosphogluconolactonase (cycloisomerase 2 family)
MKKKVLILLLFGLNNSYSQSLTFDAKGLLFLSDADFNVKQIINGTTNRNNGNVDKLGGFMFPLSLDESQQFSEETISNSVFSNSKAIAVKSDNRIAYILETKGSYKKDDLSKTLNKENLPDGGYVSVADISNLRNLKPDYRFPVAANPMAISLNKNNEYLAVASEAYKQELQVFELNEFGKPIRVIQKPSMLENGAITDVEWHPSGDFLAYIKKGTKEIGLIKVIKDGPTQKIIRLELHGNTLKLEGLPKMGKFSKDGKYFFVLDSKNEIGDPNVQKGQVFVIKFNLDEQGNHFLISKVDVEENPADLAVHPDGTTFAVSNIKRSHDFSNSKIINKSSISFLKLNSEGGLNLVSNVDIEGIMPQSIVFDKTGKNVAVACVQFYNFGKPMGGITFYKFQNGQVPKIEKQTSNFFNNTGLHHLKVIEDF